ncbi:MAG: hypothetical protein OXU23_03255 [Candidatus Poribacteria bacterium]|nr:hypothetical protein [Candidatus Poribacteria bacterium]
MRIKALNCIHRFYTFLFGFRSFIGKKKIVLKSFLSLVLLCVFLSGHSYAKIWNDSFDDEELIVWEPIVIGNQGRAKWEAIAGFLFANIEGRGKLPPGCGKNSAGFLHWKIIQLNFEQLTIVGEEITYPQEGEDGMGELCLFIGKRQDDPDLSVEGYLISPEEVSRVTFSENGKYSRGKTKAWYGNIFESTTCNLATVFDSGHFQVWTDGDLITEFVDENIKNIDIVGLLITCHFGGGWFGSRISSISITDKAIPKGNLAVQLRDTQLTTTWGELKQFE